MCQRSLNAIEKLLKSARALYKCLKPFQNCFKLSQDSITILKVSEASKLYWNVPESVLNLPITVLNCQKLLWLFWMYQTRLNAIKNLLKSARALYNCLKLFQNCFKLLEDSITILKVTEASKFFWKLSVKCQSPLQVS